VPECFFAGASTSGPGSGQRLFFELVTAAFVMSCGACLLAADAISFEIREGTVGLLLLTSIKARDVVIAKLCSVGVTSLGGMVALLPVLAIPVLAGGVTFGESFRIGLALLNTLLFALSAGLFVSAVQQECFQAARKAVGLVAAVVLLPMVAMAVDARSVFNFPRLLSPLALLISATASYYAVSPATYWVSQLVVLSLAALLLSGATERLRQSVRTEKKVKSPKPPPKPTDEEDLVGLGRWRPFFTETNPMEWLAYRQYGVSIRIWASAVLTLSFSGLVFEAYQPGGIAWRSILAWPLGAGAALIGGAVVAWLASGFFTAMRRSGELELVLTTPLGANTIVSAQWLVLKRLFFWPVLGLQAALLLPVLATVAIMRGGVGSGQALADLLALALCFANSALGIVSVCWIGMWFGLRTRGQMDAILWTVGLTKAVPWLASLLSTLVIQFLAYDLGRPASGPIWSYGMSAVVGLAFQFIPQLAILAYLFWLIERAQSALPLEMVGMEIRGARWPFPRAERSGE
jgi:hypothetical protein